MFSDYLKLTADKQVNMVHWAITRFLEHCVQSKRKEETFLVTQNIDGLQAESIRNSNILMQARDPRYYVTRHNTQAFTPWVYELHGNANLMHCSKEEEKCSR